MHMVKGRKKIILSVAVIAVILAGILVIWGLSSKTVLQGVPRPDRTKRDALGKYKDIAPGSGLEPAAENDVLKLYFDNETGGIAVEDKGSSKMFYSSPQNAMEDAKASDIMKKQLSSPLLLTYFNLNSKTTTVFDSYTNAFLLNQISWAKIEKGIRVNMVLGREEASKLLPEQISAASFEELAAQVEETSGGSAAKRMKAFYLLYRMEEADEEQKAKYPGLNHTDLYSLKSSITDRDKRTLEEYYKKAGYTYEKMEQEYEELGFVSAAESFPCFKASIDYVLENASLEVILNTGELEYDSSQFYLTYLSLLPYFGASGGEEDGYVFLPDGSGTLIDFNNDGRKNTFLTRGKVYGYDAAESNVDRGSIKNEFRYPVFGIKTGNKAIMGVITEGDALAGINCELGNISHSYNTAYADFMLRYNDKFMASNAFEQDPWIVYDKKGYDGIIAMKYYFLTGEDADYTGMAKAYRSHLLEEGSIAKITDQREVPFMLETIGTVKKPVKTLGIPHVANVAITSFEDAGRMMEYFLDQGVSNLKLRYRAWYNGGYYHSAASDMKVERAVGGRKGLKELAARAEELNVELYPDVDFLLHDYNTQFDNFNANRDGVRTLFQKTGYYPQFIAPLLKMGNWYYSVNPQAVLSYYESFTEDYNKIGIDSISLGSAGEVLNSNYKNSNYVNREDSKNITTEMLKRAQDQYSNILVDGGNAYTLGFTDYILNLPTTDSAYLIADRSVPFIQIALNGYIEYSGTAINLSSDWRKELMTCLEYGTAPYFLLCYNDSSLLKESEIYDSYYSVNFDIWKEQAVSIYRTVNEVLSGVRNSSIHNHEKMAEDVYRTVYDNGTGIYVNYSDEIVEIDGLTIAPMGYAVEQIGGR